MKNNNTLCFQDFLILTQSMDMLIPPPQKRRHRHALIPASRDETGNKEKSYMMPIHDSSAVSGDLHIEGCEKPVAPLPSAVV